MNKKEARALTQELRDAIVNVAELAVRAYTGRAWELLGYASWDAYCAVEFDQRVKLAIPHRREAVEKMTEEGMSTRAQAAVLNVGNKTVARDQTGVSNDTPELVTGRDGKTYPRRGHHVPPARGDKDPEEELKKMVGLMGEMAGGLAGISVHQRLTDITDQLAELGPVLARATLTERDHIELAELGDEMIRVGGLLKDFARNDAEFDIALRDFIGGGS